MITGGEFSKTELENQCVEKIKELGALCYNMSVDGRLLPDILRENADRIRMLLSTAPAGTVSVEDIVTEIGFLCFNIYVDGSFCPDELAVICQDIERINGQIHAYSTEYATRQADDERFSGAGEIPDREGFFGAEQPVTIRGDELGRNESTGNEHNGIQSDAPPWNEQNIGDPEKRDFAGAMPSFGADMSPWSGHDGTTQAGDDISNKNNNLPFGSDMPPWEAKNGQEEMPMRSGHNDDAQFVPGVYDNFPKFNPEALLGNGDLKDSGEDFKINRPFGMEAIPENYYKCRKCGYRNRSYANFCGKCGAPINGGDGK